LVVRDSQPLLYPEGLLMFIPAQSSSIVSAAGSGGGRKRGPVDANFIAVEILV
jgi:hypothetical protein